MAKQRVGGGGTSYTSAKLLKQLKRLKDPKDTAAAITFAAFLLVLEAILCSLIIWKVPYTEIDWIAYMQEVRGYQQGQLDYAKLQGDTGPLVYPAGFVYLFSFLREVTGEAVLPAQVIFAGLYLATQAVVMALYIRAQSLPPWSLALLCLSRRLHSIFLLRLFNDCWAMFVAYCATLALQSKQWTLAVVLYSAAVSIKMNVLLMAPGVLAVLIKGATPKDLVCGMVAGIALQLVLGAPFLLAYPASYINRAFEFTRVFLHTWTVNWKFLPEPWFVSPRLALLLLAAHLRLLWSYAQQRWFFLDQGAGQALLAFWHRGAARARGYMDMGAGMLNGDTVLYIVFTANFVGILCARSLHFQFYSWYFHTLPFLLLRTQFPPPLTLLALLLIEVVWNIFPSRPSTSALLLALHLLVLAATWFLPQPYPQETKNLTRRKVARRR